MADARADAAGDDAATLASLMDGWSDSDWLSVLAPAAASEAACGQSYGGASAGSGFANSAGSSALQGGVGRSVDAKRSFGACGGDVVMEVSSGASQQAEGRRGEAVERFLGGSSPVSGCQGDEAMGRFSSPTQSCGAVQSDMSMELSPGRRQGVQRDARWARTTRDSNVTRKREREELQSLQVEAHQLERQLASTQMLRGSPVAGRDRGEMWARVARNQVAAKQRAELQNAALREILREQLRMAQSMQRMLNRRPSETALYRALGGARHSPSKRVRCDPEMDENQAFQVLFGKVDQALADIDSVFSVDNDGLGHSLAHQNCHQFKYSAVIPFDMKLAISAAWEFLSSDQIDVAGGEYRVVASSESTIACKSIETLSLDGAGDARVRMRCVMKRMEDRGRILLVWLADTGPELNRKPCDRTKEIRMGQRGWAILSDASTSSISGVSAATAIQICVRLDSSALSSSVPHREHTTSDGNDSARAFSDRFVRDAQEKFGIWYQYVENILLERQRAIDLEEAAAHRP